MLCHWLTRWPTLTLSLERGIGRLLIRGEFAISDFNRVFRGEYHGRMCYSIFQSEAHREKLNKAVERVATMTPAEKSACIKEQRVLSGERVKVRKEKYARESRQLLPRTWCMTPGGMAAPRLTV